MTTTGFAELTLESDLERPEALYCEVFRLEVLSREDDA